MNLSISALVMSVFAVVFAVWVLLITGCATVPGCDAECQKIKQGAQVLKPGRYAVFLDDKRGSRGWPFEIKEEGPYCVQLKEIKDAGARSERR